MIKIDFCLQQITSQKNYYMKSIFFQHAKHNLKRWLAKKKLKEKREGKTLINNKKKTNSPKKEVVVH
jgi:hypothetical protein